MVSSADLPHDGMKRTDVLMEGGNYELKGENEAVAEDGRKWRQDLGDWLCAEGRGPPMGHLWKSGTASLGVIKLVFLGYIPYERVDRSNGQGRS